MPKKKPSTFEALLGPMLLSKIGEYIETPNFRNFKNSFFHHGPSVQTDEALKGKDFIVLYFSGAWCPSCQRFTPLLKDFYAICKDKANQEKLKKVDIEIVYISSDRDLDEFQKTYRDMPWLALESQKHKTSVSKKCHIANIPSLVVLDRKGRFITDTATDNVVAAGGFVEKVVEVIELWRSQKGVPLDEATFTNSGSNCIIS